MLHRKENYVKGWQWEKFSLFHYEKTWTANTQYAMIVSVFLSSIIPNNFHGKHCIACIQIKIEWSIDEQNNGNFLFEKVSVI